MINFILFLYKVYYLYFYNINIYILDSIFNIDMQYIQIYYQLNFF